MTCGNADHGPFCWTLAPFFDRDFLDPSGDNEIRLYHRTFHPTVRGLHVIGLVQPLGASMPIAERQLELAAEHLQGRYALPGSAEIAAEIDRHRKAVAKRYVASKRHTIQVDFDDHMRPLHHERTAGVRRARRPGAEAVPHAARSISA